MKKIDSIKSQGKGTIIAMAYDLLAAKQPALKIDPNDYEVTVWANSTEIQVRFRRLIRYVSKDQWAEYDITVNLIRNEILPFDDWFRKDKFFEPDDAQQQVIAYLKELLNLPYPHMENNISEDEENYYVDLTSKTAFSHQIISKATGERLAPLEGTYAVMPDTIPPSYVEADPMVEIK